MDNIRLHFYCDDVLKSKECRKHSIKPPDSIIADNLAKKDCNTSGCSYTDEKEGDRGMKEKYNFRSNRCVLRDPDVTQYIFEEAEGEDGSPFYGPAPERLPQQTTHYNKFLQAWKFEEDKKKIKFYFLLRNVIFL